MTTNDSQKFLENGERYIAASADVKKAVLELVRSAAQSSGSNMGALFLLDESRGVLKPAVTVNLPEEYVRGCGEIPLGQQCCGRAALHKLPWYVEDIWNDPVFSAATREAARRAGVRAGISVPVLTAHGKCIGSLSAHFPEPHTPTDYEVERQLLFAQLIGSALSRETDITNQPISPQSEPRIAQDERQTSFGSE
jgi:GAF domain-containing protein